MTNIINGIHNQTRYFHGVLHPQMSAPRCYLNESSETKDQPPLAGVGFALLSTTISQISQPSTFLVQRSPVGGIDWLDVTADCTKDSLSDRMIVGTDGRSECLARPIEKPRPRYLFIARMSAPILGQ